MSKFKIILILVSITFVNSSCFVGIDTSNYDRDSNPVKTRFYQISDFAGNTILPILNIRPPIERSQNAFVNDTIHINVDVSCNYPPLTKVRIVHYDPFWREDSSALILSSGNMETSMVNWVPSERYTPRYDYTGHLALPNSQVVIRHSGNWKAIFFEERSGEIFAEVPFFVVEGSSSCELNIYPDFYKPVFPTSNTSFNFEARVSSNTNLTDANLNTTIIYQSGRWKEGIYISQDPLAPQDINYKHRYKPEILIGGTLPGNKIFRADKVPAGNAHRIMDLSQRDFFPRSNTMFPFAFNDLLRTGNFDFADNNGLMLNVPPREYLNLEMVFNPLNMPIEDEGVFLSGSFNNWNPDIIWEMIYDPRTSRYYMTNWFPRGIHDYMICTGKYNGKIKEWYDCSCDKFEGNNATNGHTYFAFNYYYDLVGRYYRITGICNNTSNLPSTR